MQNKHGSDSRIYRGYKNTYETSQNLLETGEQFDLLEDKSTASIIALSTKAAQS